MLFEKKAKDKGVEQVFVIMFRCCHAKGLFFRIQVFK